MERTLRFLVACTFTAIMVVAFDRAAAVAATCPDVYLLQSSNAHDYVVVFSGARSQRASLAITLYGNDHAYGFSLDDLAIDKPLADSPGAFRSAPTLVENPDNAPLIAESVVAKLSDGSVCTPVRGQIPSVDQVLHPRFERSAESLATLQLIVAETAALPTVVNPELRTDIAVPQCAEPFSDARTQRIAAPAYPDVAIAAGAKGRATVKVTLSDSGSVTNATIISSSGNAALDESAIKSASETTYEPGTFLCKPYGGAFLFLADFKGQAR
ncbi:MAG: energy transducer TonB [Candidatus Eremiobacteraeota bacterium]|nr:energy transducer TonB [Candidatus Eremiobacteraeota bacterium]